MLHCCNAFINDEAIQNIASLAAARISAHWARIILSGLHQDANRRAWSQTDACGARLRQQNNSCTQKHRMRALLMTCSAKIGNICLLSMHYALGRSAKIALRLNAVVVHQAQPRNTFFPTQHVEVLHNTQAPQLQLMRHCFEASFSTHVA